MKIQSLFRIMRDLFDTIITLVLILTLYYTSNVPLITNQLKYILYAWMIISTKITIGMMNSTVTK